MSKLLLFTFASILLFSCEGNKIELEKRIAELEVQLDECQNGPEKISGKIQAAFNENQFESVKQLFSEMKEKHSGSTFYSQTKEIFDQVLAMEEKLKEEEIKKAENEKAEKLKALNRLKKNLDDVSGTTWYKNSYFTHYTNTNLTSLYIGEKDGSVWLRLQMTYKGDDWIFFENAFLSYEGNTKEIFFDKYENKETENSGGGVWEWIDVQVDDSLIPFLKEFAKSSDAKMRLSGKYSKTRNLGTNEKKGILDVISGYESLKSTN